MTSPFFSGRAPFAPISDTVGFSERDGLTHLEIQRKLRKGLLALDARVTNLVNYVSLLDGPEMVAIRDAAIEARDAAIAAAALTSGFANSVYVSSAGDDSNSGAGFASAKATIQGALDLIGTGKGNIVCDNSTFNITEGIVLDADRHRLIGSGDTVINAAAMTSGVAVTINADSATTPYKHVNTVIRDIEIIGNGGTGPGNRDSSVIGLAFASDDMSDTNKAIAHICAENVNVHNFGTGHYFGNQAYNINMINCDAWECAIGIHAINGIFNGGERISYYGSTIFNNDKGIFGENQNGELHFIECSVDYCDVWIHCNNSSILVIGGHLERRIDNSVIPILIEGVAGNVNVLSAPMVLTGTYVEANAPEVIVQNDCTGMQFGAESTFRDISASKLQTASGAFAKGAGRTVVNFRTNGTTNPIFDYVNREDNYLSDPSFDVSTNPNLLDYWAITNDSSITSRQVSANCTLVKSTTNPNTGTRHLRITKTSSAAQAISVDLLVPVPWRGAMPWFDLMVAKPGFEMVGNVSIGAYGVLVAPGSTAGVPIILRSEQLSASAGTFALTSGALAYTKKDIGSQHRRMSNWATHLDIRIYFDSAVTAGDLDIDDLFVSFR